MRFHLFEACPFVVVIRHVFALVMLPHQPCTLAPELRRLINIRMLCLRAIWLVVLMVVFYRLIG